MDVAGNRRNWFKVSGVILLISLFFLVFQGLNLGVDFTGGILMQVAFEREVTSGEVLEVLSKPELGDLDLGASFVQPVDLIGEKEDLNIMMIRTRPLETEEISRVMTALQDSFGQVQDMERAYVGPDIGREISRQAVLAMIIACILIVVYVSIRFEYKFAIAAILALIHDTVIVLGVISITGMELNRPFIAAILTIIGYSINDTIVVYDKIRENLQIKKGNETILEVVNKSIKQTIRRSINTSVTTLFVVTTLLIFGAPVIRSFSLALFVGVIVGTYSSIFIAGPVWLEWKLRGKA